jgi:hypothetical protein
MPLASIPVPQVTRGGWHALDITPVLRELLLNAQGPAVELMLGVRFEAPKGKTISPEHFLHDPEDGNVTKINVASPAFLVVFSEDSPDNGLMEDGGEIHLQITRPHTHAMAEMLQNAGGVFLREVVSVPKHLTPKTDKSVNIDNKTKDDDFYLESSENSYRNKETDSSLRHKHKSKAFKENISNLYEKIISAEAGNNPTEAQKDPMGGQRPTVFRRRRVHLKAKTRNPEDKLASNKPSSRESKKSYFGKTNDVELSEGSSSHRRLARSILDNELPEEDPHPTKSVPRTSPGSLLQGRKNGSATSIKEDVNTIPLPSGESFTSSKRWKGGNKRRRGRGKKRGEHKKKSRKLTENWQHLEQVRLCLGHLHG